MAFFDWVFKQRYDSEKAWLNALLDHTENWYNEITEPLKDLLFRHSMGRVDFPASQIQEIARQLFFNKIESNHGNYVRNTLEQMNDRGIPLFTSRHKLQARAEQFLESGHFLKEVVIVCHDWPQMTDSAQYQALRAVRTGWEGFGVSKERLVIEINHQLRRLG